MLRFSIRWGLTEKLTICVLAATVAAMGQTTRGSINGLVSDSSGAVVSGAAVRATQTDTGFSYSVQSNADGNYVVPALLPGTYSVKVEKAGFQSKIVQPVEVNVDARVQVDVQLDVKGAQEVVTVEAKSTQIEVDSAAIGQVVRSKAIVDLPLNGRNFLELALLSAGAVPLPAGNSDSAANNQPSIRR